MKRSILLVALFVFVVVFLAAGTYYNSTNHYSLAHFMIDNILVSNNQKNTSRLWSVYLAFNNTQLEQGLMGQSSIGNCNGGQNACIGMLFVFPREENLCFWMKNTEIPLSQEWINDNGTVVYIYNGTPFSTNQICYRGRYVLETQLNNTVGVGNNISFLK